MVIAETGIIILASESKAPFPKATGTAPSVLVRTNQRRKSESNSLAREVLINQRATSERPNFIF